MAVRASEWEQIQPDLTAGSRLGVARYRLGVTCVRQNQTEWCWAACIDMALEQQGNAAESQPQVVRRFHECSASEVCNLPCPPEDVAKAFHNNFVTKARLEAPVDELTLRSQIAVGENAGIGNAVAVGWEGNPRHMVLVVGFLGKKYIVCDPANDSARDIHMSIDELSVPIGSNGVVRTWEWTWLDLRR